jgi:hypothetical protein
MLALIRLPCQILILRLLNESRLIDPDSKGYGHVSHEHSNILSIIYNTPTRLI